MLEHIKVFLDVLVFSYSWEGKGLIIKLIGMNGSSSSIAVVFGEVLPDFHGVIKIFDFKVSGEVFHLPFELKLGIVKSFITCTIGEGINGLTLSFTEAWVLTIKPAFSEGSHLNGTNRTHCKQYSNYCGSKYAFHSYK